LEQQAVKLKFSTTFAAPKSFFFNQTIPLKII